MKRGRRTWVGTGTRPKSKLHDLSCLVVNSLLQTVTIIGGSSRVCPLICHCLQVRLNVLAAVVSVISTQSQKPIHAGRRRLPSVDRVPAKSHTSTGQLKSICQPQFFKGNLKKKHESFWSVSIWNRHSVIFRCSLNKIRHRPICYFCTVSLGIHRQQNACKNLRQLIIDNRSRPTDVKVQKILLPTLLPITANNIICTQKLRAQDRDS